MPSEASVCWEGGGKGRERQCECERGGHSEMQSAEELRSSLAEYREQLAAVEAHLGSDEGQQLAEAERAELEKVRGDLADVITMTEELVRDAEAVAGAGGGGEAEAEEDEGDELLVFEDGAGGAGAASDADAAAAGPAIEILPADEDASQRPAAAAGVEEEAAGGPSVSLDDNQGYAPVAAPQIHRSGENDADEARERQKLMKKHAIKANDDERTRVKKTKILKSLKKKERFSKLDQQQSDKKSNWQSFLKGKGSKKKKGFMTGRKKESIFKTSEGGKVGVTGSGNGVTDFQERKKHSFASN